MTQLSVQLPDDLMQRAEQTARQRGVSLDQFFCRAVSEAIRTSEGPFERNGRVESPEPADHDTTELREKARQSRETLRKMVDRLPADLRNDRFLSDTEVYDGHTPPDLAANHDKYLYGDPES